MFSNYLSPCITVLPFSWKFIWVNVLSVSNQYYVIKQLNGPFMKTLKAAKCWLLTSENQSSIFYNTCKSNLSLILVLYESKSVTGLRPRLLPFDLMIVGWKLYHLSEASLNGVFQRCNQISHVIWWYFDEQKVPDH